MARGLELVGEGATTASQAQELTQFEAAVADHVSVPDKPQASRLRQRSHHLERGRGLLLLWDGLPAHRSRCVTDWIKDQRAWLSVERLPGYAPELNPPEQVFGNLKSTELANVCRRTITEVEAIAEDGLDRIGTDAELCLAFLRHAGLHLLTQDRRRLHDPL